MGDKKILIVDDEQDVLSVLGKRLSSAGFNILTADNGSDALRLVKDERPDLVILDVMMPDMPGGAVGLSLKEDPETKDIPIMFLSCIFSDQCKDNEPLFGGNIRIAKPYDYDKLLEKVKESIGKSTNMEETVSEQKKILLVDDEPDLRAVLGKRLSSKGFFVLTAENGMEALEIVSREHPDLVLLDIFMPQMDGDQVAAQMADNPETADIPVIFISCLLPKDEEEEKGHTMGGVVMYAKPYETDELLTEIDKVLTV